MSKPLKLRKVTELGRSMTIVDKCHYPALEGCQPYLGCWLLRRYLKKQEEWPKGPKSLKPVEKCVELVTRTACFTLFRKVLAPSRLARPGVRMVHVLRRSVTVRTELVTAQFSPPSTMCRSIFSWATGAWRLAIKMDRFLNGEPSKGSHTHPNTGHNLDPLHSVSVFAQHERLT